MKTYLTLAFSFAFCVIARGEVVDLRTGDLIFQTSKTPQSRVIQKATGSPYSHVGIVEVSDAGEKFVLEASATVKSTDLDEWINRGVGGRYAVYRDPHLSLAKANELVSAAKRYFGRSYDIYFTRHNSEIYCSELVDFAARDIGLEWGHYQKFGSLNVRNEEVMGLAQARWRGHPLCRDLPKFEDCWPRIEEDLMVTPVSLTEDGKLQKIFSNY